MSAPIRVLVADDHPLFREGLRSLLADAADVELVAEAADGDQAIALAREHRPDVVLMDLRMPGTDGVAATRSILAEAPAVAVVVLTMSDDDGAVFAAMRAGARGYVLKGSAGPQILESVRIAASGRAIFDAAVADRMGRYFTRPRGATASGAFPQLSARETEILGLLADGLTNGEIADRLVLSDKTVRNNVSAILTKIDAPTRAAAGARARDAGLRHG